MSQRTLHLLLFGTNLWMVSTWLPAALVGRVEAPVLAALPCAPLVIGAVLAERGRRRAAQAFLLLLFPWAISANLLALPVAASLPYVASAAASLIAYGWAAILAVSSSARPLDPRPLGATPATPRRIRALLIGLAILGAALVTWVAPWSGRPETGGWGSAEAEGAVVAALGGGIVGTAVLALFLGTTLRRGRRLRRRFRAARLVFALTVVAVSLAGLAWQGQFP